MRSAYYSSYICQYCKQSLEVIIIFQETRRISTLNTFHKRRPPGPTVMYFAGGYSRRSLDVLECFDPQTLKWTILYPRVVLGQLMLVW